MGRKSTGKQEERDRPVQDGIAGRDQDVSNQLDKGGRFSDQSGRSADTLVSLLGDREIRVGQRIGIAAELGRSLGNRQLQSLLRRAGRSEGDRSGVSSKAIDLGQRTPAGEIEADQRQSGLSNAEVRRWYLKRISIIPLLNQIWVAVGLSAYERAQAAYKIRHEARLKARSMMADKIALRMLQARDKKKYGNPNGPTFEWLVKRYRAQGLKGDAVYEAIVSGASRTDAKTNKRLGLQGGKA